MNTLFLLATVLFGIIVMLFAYKMRCIENRMKVQEEVLNEYRRAIKGGGEIDERNKY